MFLLILMTLIVSLTGCSSDSNPPQEHQCLWELRKGCISTEKHELEGGRSFIDAYLSYPVVDKGQSKNESCKTPDRSDLLASSLYAFSCFSTGVVGKTVLIEVGKSDYVCPFDGGYFTANAANFEMKAFLGDSEVSLNCGEFEPGSVVQ